MKPTTEILYASLRRRVAIKVKTDALLMKINTDLDRIHDEAIARFNQAKQRQEAAKGNLTKTNEILDLINKGINGAK